MTAGRNGMGKFWSYMASLGRKVPVCELLDKNTKEKVEDIARHLTAHIRGIYDSTQPHDSPTSPTACGTANPKDSLWKVRRLAIDRAISKISCNTAKGLGWHCGRTRQVPWRASPGTPGDDVRKHHSRGPDTS
ncbi:hypothetical protein MRX96_034598 [Rhipicephalus microplus]